jgi:hypothetical protein
MKQKDDYFSCDTFCTSCSCDLNVDPKKCPKDINKNSVNLANLHECVVTEANETLFKSLIQKQLETKYAKMQHLKAKFNSDISEFPLVIYDHFYSVKNDIDINRETLIQELYLKRKENLLDRLDEFKYIESLDQQSAQMIKRVESLEELFRLNYEKNKPKPIETDLEQFKCANGNMTVM